MPNKQIQKRVKRGWKGPMRKATKQVEKALALAEKRRKQAATGFRKPPKGKDRVPKYPSRDTRDFALTDRETGSMDSMLTRKDLSSTAPMAIPAVALTGGLGASAVKAGVFSNKKKEKSPAIYVPPTWVTHSEPPHLGYPRSDGSVRRPLEGPSSTPNTEIFTAPVIVGVQKHGSHPKMWAKARNGEVEVVVEHTEYLCDLVASSGTGFPTTAQQYQFFANPGQDATFPWLSSLAQLFDEYKFDYLEFNYEPIVGTNVGGKTVMTYDPDVLDDFPDTKAQMLEARVQLDIPVWTRGCLKVPKDLLNQYLFVRPGSVPVGADQHVYDCGVVNLALPGASGAGTVGEFFVSYKCRLKTPNGGTVKEDKTAVVGVSLAAPLGTSFNTSAQSTLAPIWVSGTQFRFSAPGVYYVITGDGGTGFTGACTLTAPAGAPTAILDQSAGSATSFISCHVINVIDASGLYTLTAPASAATLTARNIRIFDHDLDN